MSMKKTLAGIASYALVGAVAMGIGRTLAYEKDQTATATNVETLGNVKIQQIEQQRVNDTDQQHELEAFVQKQALRPCYYSGTSIPWAAKDEWVTPNDEAWKVVADTDNVIDKFITVKNTGKDSAYVRTILAVEVGKNNVNEKFVHVILNGNNVTDKTTWSYEWVKDNSGKEACVQIGDGYYQLCVLTYEGLLEPGDTTIPSLKQIYMDKTAENEDIAIYGDTYEILAISQAVQSDMDGLTGAAALDEAFGKITATNHPWTEEKNVPVKVDSNEALTQALTTAEDTATIVLEDGTYTTNLKIEGGKDITIIGSANAILKGQIASTSSTAGTLYLNGVTVDVDNTIVDSTGISQTGKSAIAIWGNQNVVCENVTFNMSLADSTAITSWWNTGVGTTIEVRNCTFNCNGQRPIRSTANVTVENCTFNNPYRYAVQMTAKDSTATELENAVVNFNNNTIIDGENGKAFVYGVQLEGADYGCSNLIINGSGNKIVAEENDGSAMYYCECGKVDHNTVVFNTEVKPVHKK